MRTTLIALSVGVAMLGGAGIARADTMTPTEPRMEAATAGQVQLPGPLALTDSQMDKISAGHVGPSTEHVHWHTGWYIHHHGPFACAAEGGQCWRHHRHYGRHYGTTWPSW